MEFCRYKKVLLFVLIPLIILLNKAQTQTTIQKVTFTHDDTDFAFFQTTPVINQPNAQTQCINWGGNLSTIKSALEDSLLLYSSPDLDKTFTCHIGLNKTGGTDFVWIDGSTSSYRNWAGEFPKETANHDCVRFRYSIEVGLSSQGWLNNPCDRARNCYFCSKPGTSNGCDLIYDSSCYKVFEVSTPINWLDAQSSCAIWGGNLTSITTERENNYLNTLIVSSVGNSWIGLNDRDVEGMYTWIDGTAVSYTNWTSTPSDDTNSNCVQINNTGNGIWESVSCDITLNAFLCKRDPSSTIPTGARFGRISNGGLEFEELSGNTFLYDSQTLVCGGDGNLVAWEYSQNADLSISNTTLQETFNYVDFSWLDVLNTMQGYYRCTISDPISFTVGVYDKTVTTVAENGITYTYISGVDRQNVLLLCDPMNGSSLDLMWDNSFTNPVNIYSEINQLQAEPTAFNCTRDTTTIVTTYISVIVPEISVKYYQFLSSSHTNTYPTTNEVSISLSTKEVFLSTNLVGKWNIPGDTNISSSTVDIGTFAGADTGLYTFYIYNWDGIEVIAMQITISSSPALTAMTPEQEFIFNDTRFGYFSDSPTTTNWLNAQLNCNSWGGNLATIKSKEEDSLLYYTTDIQTHYACYIGLNDILNEADSDASAFTWVDGSSSAYRNFQPGFPRSDSSSDDRDCVIFRFKKAGNGLSEGWLEPVCSNSFNCHFCTKPDTSDDCDLIYDSSCYKLFEVSTPINWLDAQSSCAIWGGDLTSITTERENNYLNTLITSSVGNCWIGLNDRDVEGMYTWIDDTTFTQPSFVTTLSNNETNDCVQILNDTNWESVTCASTLTSFICKASSVIITVVRFGELIDEGLNFQSINTNTFLFNSLTLACGGEEGTNVSWKFSKISNFSTFEEIITTSSSPETGLSWLDVDISKQGYYQCQIGSGNKYILGLYNQTITTVAVSGSTYNYTVGIDRVDALLLCNPNNDSIYLGDIHWTNDVVVSGEDKEYSQEYPNPADLMTVFSKVGGGVQTFSCFYKMSPVTLVESVQLALKDTATITVNYPGSSIMTFSDANNPIFPSAQKINILVGTTDVMLTCSLSQCIWMVSNEASVITMQIYTIPAINDSYNADISLMRMTDTGVAYATAHISIISMSTESPPQSLVPIIAVIIVVILLLAVVAVVITIILVFYWVRKRGKLEQFNYKMHNGETSSENPKQNSNVQQSKDDIPLQYLNPAYIPEVDTPVVDPRTQLIPLDTFKIHMNKLWRRENALQEEYDSLGEKDHRYPCTHAKIEENKLKNRFKLMYPYDKSRVVLSMDPNGDPNSDYVNASHIPGVYVNERFIGAQAPKENTIQDFWKMIVESKVVNIVMVTNIVESGRKKCEQYFPLKIGQKLEFGPYEIIADEQQMKIGYTIKELSISHMGKTTKLRHFHFTAWPDHDVPTLYDELLLFVSKVQEGRIKTRAPILVHCSAGVGRTGTFITVYNLLAAIQQTKPISIYNVVNAMREHRPQMVQTYSQYKFIYLSVLEMLLGNTYIPTEEFIDTFGLYMQSEHEGYVSVFFQQYSELNYQCEKGFDPVCSNALDPANENKNPVKDILPCDSNRVVLESSHWPGDYINATSLDNGEIILTINPTGDTVRDFYQLIYTVEPSLVVMLCSNKELQQIEQGKSHRVVYWPKHGETLQIDSFTVTCPKSDKSSHFICNKLNIHHDIAKHNRPFTQIISNQWNDREEPNLENVITLIKTILEFRKRDPAHPVVIHCDDGAGKSGVVYTVYKAIKDSTEKGFIDIFHIVKKLRNDRMNSVTTLTHFVSCFTLMNEYCSKSQ